MSRQSTLSRMKKGSSHSTYCGECTLWKSMNAARIAPLTPSHGYTPVRR